MSTVESKTKRTALIAIVLIAVIVVAAGLYYWLVYVPSLSPPSPAYLIKEYTIAVSEEGFDPSHLEVYNPNPPEPFIIKLTITGKDTAHTFVIDELGVEQTIEAGQTVTVQFVAEKGVRGRFRFYCSLHGEEGALTIAFGGG